MTASTIDLAEATAGNSAFSRQLPGLQLAIDSTSLGEFKLCPRRYYYSIVLGYQTKIESVHLTFGILLHGARERYDHARAAGQAHQSALRTALGWVLDQTWNRELSRPWTSDHKTKNRETLLRSTVWYLDQFAEGDPLETIILSNGKPAVELSFRFDSGYVSAGGESWLYCGHLDRIARLNSEPYIVDLKTTEHGIDAHWFAKFTPFNQFSMYAAAGQVAFAVPVRGVIVDGLQVGVGFTRVQRGLVAREPAGLDEWHRANRRWLEFMDSCAREAGVWEPDPTAAWPMNEQSCDKWGGCPFRPVCSRPPTARAQWLASDYRRRVWDPLQRRGDI